ncbi:STAS domain-containing protein [Kitasatospora sp. NPDC056327]|uniref:STAS domain-containing protein n=1 Tax=Kitasatospora sp. NPDC056327 TaxID=3345785 RepID=UPI0035DE17C7
MTGPPPSGLTVTVDDTPGALTVHVAGELDYDTSGELLDAVTGRLARGVAPSGGVRLDFAGLTWIDSSGLSALIVIHRRAGEAGAALHLDNRPGVMERALHLTGLLEHLTAPRSGGPAGPPG